MEILELLGIQLRNTGVDPIKPQFSIQSNLFRSLLDGSRPWLDEDSIPAAEAVFMLNIRFREVD